MYGVLDLSERVFVGSLEQQGHTLRIVTLLHKRELVLTQHCLVRQTTVTFKQKLCYIKPCLYYKLKPWLYYKHQTAKTVYYANPH